MVKPAYPGEETTRRFNITHECIAQILIYLSYACAGFAGLVLLRCALLAAFCGIIGLTAWHRTNSFCRAWTAAALAATVACQFRGDRPYLFTFVFTAALIAILEYRRWIWALPAMFLVWANTHGGFIVGWALLGIYCAEALFLRWRGKPPADERRLWLVALVSILISGLNPNGFRVVPVMLAYRQSVAQTTLSEWQRPALWPPPLFAILLAVAAGVLVWARRRTRAADWLLLVVFGAASLTALRNMIFAALVAPALIVAYLPWKKRSPLAAEYLLALGALLGAGAAVIQGRAFQFRAAEWKYPARAADFILAHHITAPMFNTFEFGAYLIWRLWPQERVFIDGRVQSETVYLDYQRMVYNVAPADIPPRSVYQALRPRVVDGRSADALLQQYGIEMILMDGFEYTSGSPYLLAAALADPAQTDWKLVYRDAQAVIFMRHPPADAPPLRSLDALDSMEAQCREHLRHEPETPRCAAGLSDLFARIGNSVRARNWQAIATAHGIEHE
jgi:hypothetical protein